MSVSTRHSIPLLTLGFRPFFLLAAGWAIVALVIWLAFLTGWLSLPSRFDPISWHAHEMLFGVLMAAIAGFLLTAMPNWTGQTPISGAPLAGLAGLWIAGRAVALASALIPEWLAAGVDVGFTAALVMIAARMLFSAGNRRNYPLLAPLVILGLANLMMHGEAAGVSMPTGLGWRAGLGCVMMLIAVIGGRITPAFTRNWLRRREDPAVPEPDGRDTAALTATAIALPLWALLPDAWFSGAALLLAALGLGVRLSRWRGAHTAAEPLLLILHTGYGWLAVSLALLGLSALALVPPAAAIHAMTAGTAGTMILGVMSRVSLGHTGRALQADAVTSLAYILVTVAAVLRIAAAWPSEVTMTLLTLSGIGWIGAFGLFLWRYAPMLLSPRPAKS